MTGFFGPQPREKRGEERKVGGGERIGEERWVKRSIEERGEGGRVEEREETGKERVGQERGERKEGIGEEKCKHPT